MYWANVRSSTWRLLVSFCVFIKLIATNFCFRHEKIRLYAKSLNKASRTDLVTIRAKESFKLEDLNQIFERYVQHCNVIAVHTVLKFFKFISKFSYLNRLVPRIIKNSGCQERLVFSVDDDTQRAYLPSGLLIYKATKSNSDFYIVLFYIVFYLFIALVDPWMLALSKSSGR